MQPILYPIFFFLAGIFCFAASMMFAGTVWGFLGSICFLVFALVSVYLYVREDVIKGKAMIKDWKRRRKRNMGDETGG